jgi:hypothetical protein
MTEYIVTPENAETVLGWFKDRGGVAYWTSIDLSDPGYSMFTAALTPEGEPTPKPSWKVANVPADICTDPEQFWVVIYSPVDHFKVAVRWGSNGLKLKLTDGSTNRLNKRLLKARQKVEKTNPEWAQWVTYRFDYEFQQAVILVPIGLSPLTSYA